MFDEIKIAQLGYVNHVAKFNNPKVVEGHTVRLPNVIDRAVMALRGLLVKATSNVQHPHTLVSRSGAVAR